MDVAFLFGWKQWHFGRVACWISPFSDCFMHKNTRLTLCAFVYLFRTIGAFEENYESVLRFYLRTYIGDW